MSNENHNHDPRTCRECAERFGVVYIEPEDVPDDCADVMAHPDVCGCGCGEAPRPYTGPNTGPIVGKGLVIDATDGDDGYGPLAD